MTGAAPRSFGEREAYLLVGVLHVLLFAALSLALRSVTPPPPPDEGVPVEIVTAREARAAVAPPRPAPPVPSPPAPVPPEPVPEPAPPKEQPAPPKAEVPRPKAETARPIDEAAPPAKIKPKPDKAKPDAKPLDTDALDKLLTKAAPKAKSLDKTKPLDTAALAKSLDAALPKAKPLDTAALSKSLDAALPKAAALPKRGDPRVAAGLAAAIKAQVTPCWTLPAGGGAGKVTALLRLTINRDGSIAGRPGLVSQTGVTNANAAYARAFAEAAARAVLRCAPLKLPPDQYDAWKAVEINFDPGEL